jgi:Importin-beta N-terminal domain
MENLGNLEQAINLFYKSQSNDQAQLNDFLISQQRSSQAWSWLWGFLDRSKTLEIQFFGAVTLHQKLSKNWQEVPQSMHNELKEKILQKIVEFGGNGTKLVLNRLCMSVSYFRSKHLNNVLQFYIFFSSAHSSYTCLRNGHRQ